MLFIVIHIFNVLLMLCNNRHNCWGILWGPISGLAMTELILDGVCSSIDLTPFALSRFDAVKSSKQRGRKKGAVISVGEQW
jgi:hypothetical protein